MLVWTVEQRSSTFNICFSKNVGIPLSFVKSSTNVELNGEFPQEKSSGTNAALAKIPDRIWPSTCSCERQPLLIHVE